MRYSPINILKFFIISCLFLLVSTSAYAQYENNPLSVAVDNTLNNFISVGPREFFVQSESVNVGSTALQSGNISNNQSTDLRVTVRGGDQVQFDLRTSTEPRFDSLVLVLADFNGIVIDTPFFFSGFVDWRTQRYTIPGKGKFILAWVYQKDFSLSRGEDAVWVDNIRIKRDGVEVDASAIATLPWLPPILNLLLED